MIPRYTREKMGRIWSDENKYKKWLLVEILVCEALSEVGEISKEALNNIKNKAKLDIERINELERITKHDVAAFVDAISENIGEDSRFIHFGLTSSDVLDTSFALQLKEASDIIIDDLNRLLNTLKDLAYRYKDTIMIGRSHGVHAEPITFGLKMALWYEEIKRNLERMKYAKDVISYGKISGAVGTFANVDPFVEEYVCNKLGLKKAPVSSQIIQRDRHAQYFSTLAIIASSLEKFAIEIRHLQRSEVLEVEEPFSEGQKGSSAMPHKRNPIGSENISGIARVIRANSIAAMENISLWHERDISHSSVERIIAPDSTILMDYIINRMINILTDLTVYPDRMKGNLEKTRGLIFSERILLELIRKGLTRGEAYKIVQRNAMNSWKSGKDFKEILKMDKDINRMFKENELEQLFDHKYHLKHIDHIFNRVFNE
jgi:adenylosuccinate lyase